MENKKWNLAALTDAEKKYLKQIRKAVMMEQNMNFSGVLSHWGKKYEEV
jgi:hypothetical protein